MAGPKQVKLRKIEGGKQVRSIPTFKTRRPASVRCIRYPNRTRRRIFRPKDAGKIVCRILEQRADTNISLVTLKQELRRELDRCFPCSEQLQQDNVPGQAAAVAAAAASYIQENSRIIAVALAVLAALLVVPRILPFLPRAALALVPVAARASITQLPAIVARLRTQQAANDAFYRILAGLR